jgi:hypothetical protein
VAARAGAALRVVPSASAPATMTANDRFMARVPSYL